MLLVIGAETIVLVPLETTAVLLVIGVEKILLVPVPRAVMLLIGAEIIMFVLVEPKTLLHKFVVQQTGAPMILVMTEDNFEHA